ncbi:MAG: diguanylate cyclase [Anaerolineae bacterium]|nr:diguanylate cyclase [Anaerolineae bacterium]
MSFLQIESAAFFFSAFLAAGVMVWVWPRHKQPGIRNFIYTLITILIWSLAAGFEAQADTLAESRFWSILSYIGILGVPLFFFFFALYYTGYDYLLTRHLQTGLFGLSIFFWVIVATNEWHHLYWSYLIPDPVLGENLIHYGHGVLFYFAILYLYTLMTVVTLVLLQAAINFHHIYRHQVIGLLLAIPLPWASNILYVLNISPLNDKDLTPVFFSFVGLLFGYNIHHYQLLDLIPVAREKILDSLQEGILVLDHIGRIIDINTPARFFLKIDQLSVIGKNADDVLPTYKNFLNENNSRLEVECELDKPCWIELQILPFNNSQNRVSGRLVIIHDISHRKNLEKELERLAISDGLTGLYNRRYLETCLISEFERSERYHTPLSLAICDIDSFKEINDLAGHACGDEVLIRMAQLLRQCMRTSDIVARMGGDEFVIIFPQTGINEAWLALERLRLKIKAYDLGCFQQGISVSVGVTTWFEGDTTTNALQRADQHLYTAKRQGKDCVIGDEQLIDLPNEDNESQIGLFHRRYGLD